MADEIPKDYSRVYCEDSGLVTSTVRNQHHHQHRHHHPNSINHSNITSSTNSGTNNKPPVPSTRGRTYKSLDGSFVPPKHREQTVDSQQVAAKLGAHLAKENNSAYAIDTLNKHYSSVFVAGRKTDRSRSEAEFKVYIQYFNEKETTYVVKVDRNTLKAVRNKLPKRGNFRFFFKQSDGTCEEVESDDAFVPFHEKESSKQIYCQLFPM